MCSDFYWSVNSCFGKRFCCKYSSDWRPVDQWHLKEKELWILLQGMRNKLVNPKKYSGNSKMSTSEQHTAQASSEDPAEGTSVDLMEGVEGGVNAVINKSSPASAHVSVAEEPASKVAKVVVKQELPKPKELARELSSSEVNQVQVVNLGPSAWQRKKAAAFKKLLEDQRAKDKEWEERVAREHGVGLSDIGKPDPEEEKASRGKPNDSRVINGLSTAGRRRVPYRPYAAGDLVLDFSCNAKCRAVLDQSKSRNLPTLTLPFLTGVQHCCPFDIKEFGLPPFPVNQPPLNGIKYIICFNVLAPNAKDHSHQWRIMDQLTHRLAIKWARMDQRMTSVDRTTALVLKDFNNKLICKFTTFCRVEEGKLLKGY